MKKHFRTVEGCCQTPSQSALLLRPLLLASWLLAFSSAEALPSLTWGVGGTGGSGVWSSAHIWNGYTWVQNDSAVFPGTPGTITVSATETVASLTFNVSGYTLAGTGFINLISPSTIAAPAGATVINAKIRGAGLSKSGAGTLTLGAANSYTGNTSILSGILQIGGNTSVIPTGVGKGSVAVTGTLDLNTYSQTINGLSGSGTVDTIAGGTPTLTVGNNNTSSAFSGVIQNSSGTLSLTQTGTGVLTLNGANTYSGTTTISMGTLALGASGSISFSSSVAIAAGGTFDVSAFGAYALSSPSLSASGAGTTTGSTAAAINGASGGTVSLGSQDLSLALAPTALDGDTNHPALFVLQGTLSLNGNAITVSNAASLPLGPGIFTLIQQASGSIASSGTPSVTVIGSGLVTGASASIQVSGQCVYLVVTGGNSYAVFSGLAASQTFFAANLPNTLNLTGTVSAPGPIYPASGETITVTINGNAQTTTINDSTGDFSLSYLLPALVTGASYPISYGYVGDGSLMGATNTASALTLDLTQAVFVENGNSLFVYSTNGVLASTLANGLSNPNQAVFNGAGALFEADTGSGKIIEITPGGAQITFASGLSSPFGLAMNSAGVLFEGDAGSGKIYQFTPGGAQSTFATGVSSPIGLAFNSAGVLFESDSGTGSILEFTTNGTRSTFATGLGRPVGLAFDGAGNLFVADTGSGDIYEYTTNGTRTIFATGLGQPNGIAFNSAGVLFEMDWSTGVIHEFATNGTESTFASGLGAPSFLAFQPQPPAFSGLTASQSVTNGTAAIMLAGTVGISGTATYPAIGETITVTINGQAQTTTINDATGDFSLSYNLGSIPSSATPYGITYAYAGDTWLLDIGPNLGAATDSSTALTFLAGPLDHFAIAAAASPQTVGTAFTIASIVAQDANNYTVTSFIGTVAMGGTAGVTGTSGAFVAGVLNNASVTPTAAGSGESVTVSDGAGHTGSATIATVNQSFPSISTPPTASAITYGQALGASVLSGGTASVAGTFAFTSPSAAPNAGTAAQSLTFTPTDTTNYTGASATVSVLVNQAPMTVTASPQSAVYGQTAAFGSGSVLFTASALSNNETIGTVTLSCSGGASNTAVGSYAIIPSAATGGSGTETNYNITYLPGALTVTALPVQLAGIRLYDGTTNAGATNLSVSNIVGSDDVMVFSGAGGLASADIGTNAITSFGTLALGGATASNYTLAGAIGAVIVTALPVELTGARWYDGTTNADFGILSVSNIAGSDDVMVALGSGGLASADVGTNAVTSTGTLTLSGAAATNYTLSGASGAVVVTPLPIVLSGSRPYDGTAAVQATFLTVANDLDGGNLTLSGSATLAGGSVGLQTITNFTGLSQGGPAANNYTLIGASGSVTISNPFNPFSITSSSPDATGTNLVVSWESVPGVVYTVLTNTGPCGITSWASAGSPITATDTNTSFTLPGGMAGQPQVFVAIKE
jgi:autotransporter-associated beta strand protein